VAWLWLSAQLAIAGFWLRAELAWALLGLGRGAGAGTVDALPSTPEFRVAVDEFELGGLIAPTLEAFGQFQGPQQ